MLVGVGVAGWNTSAAGPNVYVSACVLMCGKARTLLGPEETPVGVFLVPLLVLVSNAGASRGWGVVRGGAGGSGCGCVLSVA